MSLLSTFTVTKMAHRAHSPPANRAAMQRACRADPHREGSGLLAVPSQHSPSGHLRPGDRTEWRLLLKSRAGPGRVTGEASSQKQMIRFSSSKTLASSGFIKFPFRLSEENKGRK